MDRGAYQAPLSLGFSRQDYWSGLLFPSPGDLPDPGIEPGSPSLQTDSLPSEPPGKHIIGHSPKKTLKKFKKRFVYGLRYLDYNAMELNINKKSICLKYLEDKSIINNSEFKAEIKFVITTV